MQFYKVNCSGIGATLMVGKRNNWIKMKKLVYDEFIDLVQYGCGHAEEQILTTIYSRNPEYFELYYGDYELMLKNSRSIIIMVSIAGYMDIKSYFTPLNI
jgi:hypothetical protein